VTSVDVISREGAKTSSVDLPADIFDVQANIPLMHQVVVAQLAAARQGTHKAKNRGEVSGGGKKPYKQKGTGRARQGSTRAPQFTGGGVVHGPVPRDYSQRTPKKMKVAALRGALSDRARDGRLHLVESFVDGDAPSTKAAVATLGKVVTEAKRVLVVLGAEDEQNWLSLRNVPTVHLIEAGQLNTYDVLVADEVVFTKEALEEFLGVPAASSEEAGA
jgi:large subunit ribosomal protein L4